MAHIRQRTNDDGTTAYQVQIRLKGFPPECASFKRLTDARKWAAATESAMREGRHGLTTEAKRHTVADLIDRYVRDVMPTKKNPTKQLNELAWWRAELGYLVLADLTAARVSAARDTLSKRQIGTKIKPAHPRGTRQRSHKATLRPRPEAPETKLIAPATVVRYLAALSHALTVAVKEWGWLDDNPMRKVSKPREPRGRVRFLSPDERARLLKACETGPEWMMPLVLLALSTGARQGELFKLRWPDVDLERKRLILRDTKNGDTRAVPLVGRAWAALKARSRVRAIDDDRVFPTVASFSHRWAEVLQRAKIASFRFHDCRHSAASELAMGGATLFEIGQVLGHRSPSMTARYSHLTEGHVAELVERMNTRVFGTS